MKYTPALYRRLRLILIPLRLAVCLWALRACWTIYGRMEDVDYSGVPAPVAFAFVNGLLIGVDLVVALMVAVFVWYPLPRPD